MKLGLAIDWATRGMDLPIEKIQRAEALGFDSIWSAEAYGSDAITPLSFIAAHTRKIRLGTGIVQMAARSPAATAMAFGTLDELAGRGRAICGLGLSGPQIVEGWYGTPWGSPVARTRDYVQIMRKVFERKAPVSHDGAEIQLPYRGPGASGMGKPLRSILHVNPKLPIWLGTGSKAQVIQTAELCDGWLPFGFRPGNFDHFKPWLEEGFARAGGGKGYADFEIQTGCQVEITHDIKQALRSRKDFVALYVGGMGHPKLNFHKKRMEREGWPEAAARIQELFLAGKRDEAVDAVPDEYIDEGGLFGTPDRIKDRYRELWENSGATGLTLHTADEEAVELMAELCGTRDRVA